MWGKEINDDAGRNAEGEREWEMGGRPVRVSKKERVILWGSTRTGGGGGPNGRRMDNTLSAAARPREHRRRVGVCAW
jgi:hypothetical protein